MKTTLLIQDGVYQVVLSPENEIERDVVKLFDSNDVEKTYKVGTFSECQGKYIRYFGYMSGIEDTCSLMLVLKNNKRQ